MKKNNNKYRNNNNNMYNLNYRFDSLSPAGKVSGTALDLIKRYNELAKEAHSSGNYVEMEVFRQYAEHYRKIVTEVNERRSNSSTAYTSASQAVEQATTAVDTPVIQDVPETLPHLPDSQAITQTPLSYKKKTLKIVEVKENDILPEPLKELKPKRTYRRKMKTDEKSTEADAI